MTSSDKRRWRVIALILFGISLIVFACILIESASAAGGSVLYYSDNIPQNDPLTGQAHQGDTLYLGKTYDLSFVTGISYEYAYWSDWREEDVDCHPDKIVDIRYYRTLTNKNAVYLDPKIWNAGNWYFWDGYECNITYYDYNTHELKQRDQPFQADNKFAFRILNQPAQKAYDDWQITQTDISPVESYRPIYEETTVTPTPAPNEKPKPADYSGVIKYLVIFGIVIAAWASWYFWD